MEIQTQHEPDSQRFVVRLDSGEATLEYEHAGSKTLYYKSTFVPEEERDRGIGEQMVLDALDWARDHDYGVIPSCPFVKSVVERHKEYQGVVVQKT